MHPYQHAEARPDHPAIIFWNSRRVITYAQLDQASNQGAHLFRSLGLEAGDTVALLLKNSPEFLEVYWAAQRCGLQIALVSTHLKTEEAAYIVNDSGAGVLVVSGSLESAAELLADRQRLIPGVRTIYTIGASHDGARPWAAALAQQPAMPVADQISGRYLVYSSGTTGRPKGVTLPFRAGPIEESSSTEQQSAKRYGAGPQMVSLCCQPLYHAAPLVFCTAAHRQGGTVVLLDRFDAEAVLQAIDTHQVTHVSMVPTMFVRLLRLPPEARARYDLSSLKVVVHAGAPCPVDIKHQMFDWLGPIIYEYYAGSEANGQCFITPQEWLRKPGSVGRASWGVLHICDEAGAELPAGEPGLVYFEGGLEFSYRNDEAKAQKTRNGLHPTWSTLGDIGYVDEEGYLFLVDRKDFMIISGGVNIYPQACEDLLISHPKVLDAAVIGVPDAEFGEAVKAVVQLDDLAEATPQLETELIAYCRSKLSPISCPRSIDFLRELPRLPTGKLAKKVLRDRYWPQGVTLTSRHVEATR